MQWLMPKKLQKEYNNGQISYKLFCTGFSEMHFSTRFNIFESEDSPNSFLLSLPTNHEYLPCLPVHILGIYLAGNRFTVRAEYPNMNSTLKQAHLRHLFPRPHNYSFAIFTSSGETRRMPLSVNIFA